MRLLVNSLENVFEVVGDLAHDETVEQRHPVIGASAGENAPAGQEAKMFQQAIKAFRPQRAVLVFCRSDGVRDPLPGCLDVCFAFGSVACLPDMAGNVPIEGGG